MKCPRCEKDLVRTRSRENLYWRCRECEGRAVSAAVLRQSVYAEAVRQLWEAAAKSPEHDGGACPACRQPMKAVSIVVGGDPMTLDLCPGCQVVWCDADEFEALPAPPAPDAKAVAAAALAEFEQQHQKTMLGMRADIRRPDLTWRILPTFLGLPAETQDPGYGERAWVTWSLMALIAGVGLLTLGSADAAAESWGFLPREPFRHFGATPVTAFFLHATVVHLLLNLYFLWMFGDDVEGLLGGVRYLGLILLATVVGCAAHVLATSDLNAPLIGASGGISGVIAYYAMVVPRARIGFLGVRGIVGGVWCNLSARLVLIFWFVFQLFASFYDLSDVSHAAHVGGAVTGLVLGWFGRARVRASPSGDLQGGMP